MSYQCYVDKGSPKEKNEDTNLIVLLIGDIIDMYPDGTYFADMLSTLEVDDDVLDDIIIECEDNDENLPSEDINRIIEVVNLMLNVTIEERITVIAILQGYIDDVYYDDDENWSIDD